MRDFYCKAHCTKKMKFSNKCLFKKCRQIRRKGFGHTKDIEGSLCKIFGHISSRNPYWKILCFVQWHEMNLMRHFCYEDVEYTHSNLYISE